MHEEHGMSHTLNEILSIVKDLKKRMKKMSAQLDALEVQVAENTSIEQSAIVLIQGIAQQLLDAQDDPEKVAALAASLKVSAGALSEAIVANTPV